MIRHRHLDTTEWTLDAVDSVLERGDLSEWRDLFGAVRRDEEIARKVLRVVDGHDLAGACVIARDQVLRFWPELAPRNPAASP